MAQGSQGPDQEACRQYVDAPSDHPRCRACGEGIVVTTPSLSVLPVCTVPTPEEMSNLTPESSPE